MRSNSVARSWHLVTALVATIAIVLQLVLVWQGHAVLDEHNRPDLGTRLIRFIGYFTILSNVLVAGTAWTLAFGRGSDSAVWRVLRLNAVVGITVTGVVHWFLLRPLLDLDGTDLLVDKLLHLVVPALAVIGWVAFGPRGRVRSSDLLPSLCYPVGWLIYTLVRGAVTAWYPYPFIDADTLGYGVVALNSAGIALLMVALSAGALWADRHLTRATSPGR
jgi:hypothetical protein